MGKQLHLLKSLVDFFSPKIQNLVVKIPTLEEFRSKIKTLGTHNLLCQKRCSCLSENCIFLSPSPHPVPRLLTYNASDHVVLLTETVGDAALAAVSGGSSPCCPCIPSPSVASPSPVPARSAAVPLHRSVSLAPDENLPCDTHGAQQLSIFYCAFQKKVVH